MEGKPQLFAGRFVARRGVDVQRLDARFTAKLPQPVQAAIAFAGPIHHVEDENHRLIGLAGLPEEPPHRFVVVFLVGKDADQHVGRLANKFCALPMVFKRAVNVGRIEQEQIGRLPALRVLSQEEQAFAAVRQGIAVRSPRPRLESRESPAPARVSLKKIARRRGKPGASCGRPGATRG